MSNSYYTLILFFAFFLWSCSSETVSNTALIQKTVEERMADFKAEQMQKCKEELLEEAVTIVDSLMIEKARANRKAQDKPAVPKKPIRPEINSAIDTTAIAPLFEK